MMSVFQKSRFLFLLLFVVSFNCHAQADSLSFRIDTSYRDWNWQSLVIQNEYITTAIVPTMGGNMLQYDFGIDTFLITNPVTYGNVYDPARGQSPFTGSWGFGGFEVWSTPETWPPSPVLTFGLYYDILMFQSADSLQIKLTSQTEINSFPGIKYEKQYTAYKNSTLIKFQNSLINAGAAPIEIGMMNVAEVMTQHAGLQDYHYFKAYFPIRKNSVFGNQCVSISPNSSAFQGEVAPGVYGIEYTRMRGKVFADSPVGWMAFVDERDTQTYVCLYDVFEGASYPDQGANTEIYIENNLAFMALEAISPLVNLSPVTDTLRFTEYFASTALNGIILKANLAGAVNERLTYDTLTQHLTGRFGVFSKSTLQLLYCDSLENVLEEGMVFSANPDTALIIDEEVELPVGTRLIKLCAFNLSGNLIADLDVEDFNEDEFVSSTVGLNDRIEKQQWSLKAFYAGDGLVNVHFYAEKNAYLRIDLINVNGMVVKELFSGELPAGEQEMELQSEQLQSGIYFVRALGENGLSTKKIIIL